MIRIKRAYKEPARGDGRRILVERLWPRGIRKEALAADDWLKNVAPSTPLREWFGHRVERWEEFQRRYREELQAEPGAWAPLLEAGRHGAVTLLYGAHDEEHNSAVVLRDFLAMQGAQVQVDHDAGQSAGQSAGKDAGKSPAVSRVVAAHRKGMRGGPSRSQRGSERPQRAH